METYEVKRVKNKHNINASVPGSKSITNRALLLGAMGTGKTVIRNVLFSDDSRVFMQALKDLGFEVNVDETDKCVEIEGHGGEIPLKNGSVYVGSAGTAARFLTAYLALSKGTYHIDASPQMKKRPMDALIIALEELGAKFSFDEEKYHFPFTVTFDGFIKKETSVSIEKSSQFLSALLICAPLFPEDFTIHILGTHGMDYVTMTLEMMRRFGSRRYEIIDGTIRFDNLVSYACKSYDIEPDLSAACYFYAAGAILGVEALVKGVYFNSLQGDIKFLSVLKEMGCSLEETEAGVRLLPSENGLSGGSFDLSSFSDQALTLAAVSVYANKPVEIQKVSHIKLQESDRINAIVSNLGRVGIEAFESKDGVVIHPGKIKGASIETFEDHRVAMSFSLLGLLTDGIVIEDPLCCKKTFENYFECLEEYVY